MRTAPDFDAGRPTARAGRPYRRPRRAAAALALALALPHAAYPCALDRLLELPIEHLLQLRIASHRVALDASRDAGGTAVPDRRPHAA